MSDERIDGLLRELRAELASMTPSPQFAARVRARVERTGFVRRLGFVGRTGFQVRLQMIVAAAGGLAVVVAVAFRQTPPTGDPLVRPQATAMVDSAARAPHVEVAVAVNKAPLSPTRQRLTSALRPLLEPEPEVLTNQPAIIRALWAHTRGLAQQKPDPPAAPGLSEAPAGEPETIAVAPVTVEPIVVGQIDPGRGRAGGMPPETNRRTADVSARSGK